MSRWPGLLLVVFLFLTFIFGPPAYPAERARIATLGRLTVNSLLPMMAAEEQGFWKEQSLEVDWLVFESGSALYQAMAAGSLDLGMSGVVSTIQAISRGVPVVVVADTQARSDFFLWVRTVSPLKEAGALKGKKLGVSRLGGITHAYARFLAKTLGIEKDVKIVAAGGISSAIGALKAGSIDAVIYPLDLMVKLKTAGEVREILNLSDYLPGKWSSSTIYGRRGFLEKNPETVKAGVKSIFRSCDYVIKNPSWALEKMKSSLGFSEEVARLLYSEIHYGKEAIIDNNSLASVINFLVEYGMIPREKAPPLNKIYTTDFIR